MREKEKLRLDYAFPGIKSIPLGYIRKVRSNP